MLQVRIALNDVALRLSYSVDHLAASKPKQAQATSRTARDSARKAYAYSRGPIWWTASKLPWIGDDVTAVRTVAEVAHDLTEDTLPDLVEAGAPSGPSASPARRALRPRAHRRSGPR